MIVAVCIIIFFAIIIFSPLKISAIYKNNTLKIKVGLFSPVFTVFDTDKKKHKKKSEKKEEKPEEKEESKPEENDKDKFSLEKIRDKFEIVYDCLKFLKKHLVFHKFTLKLALGTGDAAQTAISVGAGWALFYNIAGVIDKTFVLKKHNIDVKPVYDREWFSVFFESEAGIGLIWGIIMLVSLLKSLKKIR